jgi:plastocyanin
MHGAVFHFVPVLAADKSKLPFYIAGGALVAWALILSVAIGMRTPSFPASQGAERAVIAISVVLVGVTASMAVLSSGGEKSVASAATSAASTPEGVVPPATAGQGAAPSAGASAAPTSGGSSSSAPGTSATTGTPPPASSPAAKSSGPLKLAADPSGTLSYNTKQLSAAAGKVTVDFVDASPVPHDVVIAQGSKVLGQTPVKTGSSTLNVTLKPGTYTFYCSVPGHRQAGMQGTLTVS